MGSVCEPGGEGCSALYMEAANGMEATRYGKPFGFLFSISRYRELFPDIGNSNSRYREINFRYREMVDFPISGNDFRISGIDFPISGNVLDFPISGNQFPISKNRHPTDAGHSAILQHRPTTPPPINNGPQLYRPHLLADTVITTSVNRSVHTPKLDQCNQQSYNR